MLAASVTVTFLGIYTTGSVYAVAVVVPTLIGVEIGYWGLNRYSPFALKSILQTGYLDTLQLVEDYRLKLFRRKN
jgi:hypothetical protein